MNEKNRLNNASNIWKNIKVEEEIRRGINNDIGAVQKKIEDMLVNDEKDISLTALKNNYKRVLKLEGDRKEVNGKSNKLKASLEDCIMGKGDFDAAQLTIEDILEKAELAKEGEKEADGKVNKKSQKPVEKKD